MAEFTGERVIPGLVEASLWDEHASRYAFAAAFAAGERVLDIGCGTGYGTAAMAESAACALGFDISPEAVDYATLHYGEKAKFMVGSAENFPADIGSFGLITAFEVIEHLTDWPRLLSEANRVLADDGVFLVSTPNKTYYGEARQREGPNPFHVHEFEFEEFREALSAWSPHVRILAQNRVEAFSFFGEQSPGSGTATFAEAAHRVSDAHFYIAVCGRQPIPPLSYLYVPHDGNMLWERERHIHLLEQEMETLRQEREVAATQLAEFESSLEERRKWIAGLEKQTVKHQRERDKALAALKTAEHELEKRTEWAARLQSELTERTAWAQNLEQDLTKARSQIEVGNAQLKEFESDLEARNKWITSLQQQIESDLEERGKWIASLEQQILDHQGERDAALAALKTAEQELEQRTNWAKQLQSELTERTEWAQSLDQELSRAREQMDKLVAKLREAEAVIIERTKWERELEAVIAELTGEVTRGRNELGLLLAALRAQSSVANGSGRAMEVGQSPSLPQNEFAELRELVEELEKLRVAQARSFEAQMQTRSELQRRVEALTQERALVARSRWLKLGRALGLGPKLN